MKAKVVDLDVLLKTHAEYLSGRPVKEIASELGMSASCLKKQYVKNNLKIPNASEVQFLMTSYKNSISKELEEKAVEYYVNGGAIEETADKYKITCKRLRLLLKERGIQLRTKGEQIKLLGEDFHKQRVANSQKAFKDKYGVNNAMFIPEIAKKVSESLRKTRRDDSQYVLPNGELLVEVADRTGIAPTTLRNVWRRLVDPVLVQKWIDTYDIQNTYTDIEVGLQEALIKAGVPCERLNKSIPGVDFNYRPDLHVPGTNIYIDCDGLYWHSEKFRDRNYHFDKCKAYRSNNLRCFQLRSDEILDKLDICTSIIGVAYGKSEKVHARKCLLKVVGKQESDLFFEINHLMGSINGTTALGLYLNDELIFCVSYRIKKDNSIELSRVCTKLNTVVVGGLSKVIKYIENKFPDKDIISFVDFRYADGHSLTKMGFELKHVTVGFKWFKQNKTYNRSHCTANMDERGLTEAEHAEELGLSKIYDAGQALFVKNRSTK